MTFFKPNTKRTAYIAKLTRQSDIARFGTPFLVTFMTDDGFEDILDCHMPARTEAEAIEMVQSNGFVGGLN